MKKFVMTLKAPGNPDFQQYADIAPEAKSIAEDLDKLREDFLWYLREHDMGGGNCGWTTGMVFEVTGHGVTYHGRFSYNGRFWDKDHSDEWFDKYKDEEIKKGIKMLKKGLPTVDQLKKLYEEEYEKFLAEAEKAATT